MPSAPACTRPAEEMTPEEVHRWNLCVAVAWDLLGDNSSWRQITFCARHLYYDPGPPTE